MPGLTNVGPPTGDDELAALVEINNRTYLRSEEEGQAWLKRVRPSDLRVVRSDGHVAGGLSLLPMGQFFGGRSVPMTGVASVGIAPERRSGGLASSLMRSVLEELHAGGVALSALYPATQPVYRRAGWELAGDWIRYTVPATAIDVRDRALDIDRLTEPSADALRPMYERRARTTPGNLDRSDDWWERMILSTERESVNVYTTGGEGYVVLAQRRDGSWKYDLTCRDLVALTPQAGRRLLTFLADHRSFARNLVWTGAPADPMTFHLGEQDWEVQRRWTWMLRVVDVRGALGSRGYPPGLEAELHLEMADDVLPWNHGRFVLEISAGTGKVRKGGRGRIRMDVRGLASLYTGFMGAEAVQQAGYADGADRDLAAATAAFAGPAPWSADFF